MDCVGSQRYVGASSKVPDRLGNSLIYLPLANCPTVFDIDDSAPRSVSRCPLLQRHSPDLFVGSSWILGRLLVAHTGRMSDRDLGCTGGNHVVDVSLSCEDLEAGDYECLAPKGFDIKECLYRI